MKTTLVLLGALLGLASCSVIPDKGQPMKFNDAEIRQAERELEVALSSSDPLAWVDHYTEDAVFVAPGAAAVEGRDGLTRMARAMRPLSSVQIQSIRTEGSGSVAAVYGRGAWVSGAGTAAESSTKVRLIIVWRKGSDGRWRVAQELLHAEPPPP